MNMELEGKFIVIDGPDGCGKSTQTKLLTEWLNSRQIASVSFRDPGGTAIGEKIREILLNPEHLSMSTETEVLLYMSARIQLWLEKIEPALDDKKCVVLDRWLSSTYAYQGWAGAFGVDKVIRLAQDCLERVWPDLAIILDVDTQTATSRLDRELDRMEAKGDIYHNKVRAGFLKFAEEHENVFVVDAADEIQEVHKKILRIIEEVSFS
ncbi:MAG: dTMP kinase [Sedimentisphaerales bacterium]